MAWASAGCTALNGTFSGGVTTGSTSGTGFSAGDTITITVTAAGGADTLGLYNNTTHASLLLSGNSVGSRTYVVPADTGDNFIISGTQANAGSNFSWNCSAGSGGTNSQKLTTVQTQGSAVVANTSGAAITGAVSNATDTALNQSTGTNGSTATLDILTREEFAKVFVQTSYKTILSSLSQTSIEELTENARRIYDYNIAVNQVPVRTSSGFEWVQLPRTASRFSAEERSTVRERADEAFAALGYAPRMPVKAPLKAQLAGPQWSVWGDVTASGFEDTNAAASLKGGQVNATAGIGYKPRPDVVIGAFAGYENFNYDFASLAGRLEGDGGTVGAYAGWAITPTLRLKGMVGWTGVSYDATAATAAGSFTGSRWLFSTSLAGSYRVTSFVLEPSATVFVLTERQTSYTDTLGVAHAGRDFSTGRVSLGGRAILPPQTPSVAITPYLGLYGDWRFATDNTQVAGVPFVGISDGWSARVTGGLSMPVLNVGSLTLGGEYGGIGADYKMWTGNARLTVPF